MTCRRHEQRMPAAHSHDTRFSTNSKDCPMKSFRSFRIPMLFLFFLAAATALASLRPAFAAQSREQEAKATLNALYETSPAAKALAAEAKAILVFPEIRKGGFIFGGQFGQGVLLKNDKLVARYGVDGV